MTASKSIESGPLGMSVTVALSMADAEEAIRKSLADVGFGILTEIDVAATLKAKLDVDRPAYRILGACNPALANDALNHDEQIGLVLPCNVTLSDNGSSTTISAADPIVLLAPANKDGALDELAVRARNMLETALAAVAT
jgi:uncharacterized protein (DUF302 family)